MNIRARLDKLLQHGSGDNYSHFKEFLSYVVFDTLSCPIKSWIPRIWMTICFIPEFTIDTIREWRALTKILEWEIWVPDYWEERERFFKEKMPARDKM